jgi:hypothetical protein
MTTIDENIHLGDLTIEQERALELLMLGRNDTEVAKELDLARQSVWTWRSKNPKFIAELNRRRMELYYANMSRLKAMIGQALDVVETSLRDGNADRALKAAQYVLKSYFEVAEKKIEVNEDTVLFDLLREEARAEVLSQTPTIRNDEDLVESLAQSAALEKYNKIKKAERKGHYLHE